MSFEANFRPLLQAQEQVLSRLDALNDARLRASKLCGGTALSRCYLQHRLSYDLDFFFPHGFQAQALAQVLRQTDLNFEVQSLVDDVRKANQLHGFARIGSESVKLSFIEDAYFEVYPAISATLGRHKVNTESVAGLYHRKLRTVSGSADSGDAVLGARQTARDLFDLYVLSKVHMPIRTFIACLPYTFPAAAFDNGLVGMSWFELIDELRELVVAPEWQFATDVEVLQTHLFAEIGAV